MKQAKIIILLTFLSLVAYGQTNGIYHSIEDALKDSLKVKSLDLDYKDLPELPVEILKLKNLEEVSLKKNPDLNFVQSINVLSQLSHLKKLSLDDNRLSYIPKEISKLKSLRELSLSENELLELPIELLQIKNLEDIDLGANPNLDFGKTLQLLSKLSNLKTLGLGRNGLSDIPMNISYFKNLEYLSLEDNKFTDIPKSIRKLRIKSLHLFSNNIKELNLKKGDLPNLQDINLCYNKFSRFPVELSASPELKQITIWHNNIHLIPREISRFRNIDSINMDNNDLDKIPPQFALLKKLHHLSIRNNHFGSKGINAVYHITSLKSLGLDGNNITTISGQIRNLKNLTYFNVSSNPVRDLPTEFSMLKKMKVLGLNDLHELDWTHTFSLLENLPELRVIGMSGMGLNKMPDGFGKLTQVRSFWLSKNALNKEEHERIKKLLPNANLAF